MSKHKPIIEEHEVFWRQHVRECLLGHTYSIDSMSEDIDDLLDYKQNSDWVARPTTHMSYRKRLGWKHI